MTIDDFNAVTVVYDNSDNSKWVITNIDNHHFLCVTVRMCEGHFVNKNYGSIVAYEAFKQFLIENPNAFRKGVKK